MVVAIFLICLAFVKALVGCLVRNQELGEEIYPESVAALPKISLCHQRGDFQWSFQPFLLSLSRLWGAFSLVLALEQLSGWI